MARLTLIIYTIEKHHRGLPCGWRREASKEHSGRLANANIVTFTTLFGVFNIACNYISKFCLIFLLPKIKPDIDVHVAKERVY